MEDEERKLIELQLISVNNRLTEIRELKNRSGIKENITSESIEILETQKAELEKKLNQ